tara:strand:- start:28 stop:243 length:216 start_codon:yes stop_codon:yes gene_type:complete
MQVEVVDLLGKELVVPVVLVVEVMVQQVEHVHLLQPLKQRVQQTLVVVEDQVVLMLVVDRLVILLVVLESL